MRSHARISRCVTISTRSGAIFVLSLSLNYELSPHSSYVAESAGGTPMVIEVQPFGLVACAFFAFLLHSLCCSFCVRTAYLLQFLFVDLSLLVCVQTVFSLCALVLFHIVYAYLWFSFLDAARGYAARRASLL